MGLVLARIFNKAPGGLEQVMKNKKNTFVSLLLMAVLCLAIYGVFFAETANAGGGSNSQLTGQQQAVLAGRSLPVSS